MRHYMSLAGSILLNMKKIINLIEYKNKLFQQSRGWEDEDADAEDLQFEVERLWDVEPLDKDMGFLLRANSKPYLIYADGKFCQFMLRIEKNGKEIFELPTENTLLSQCVFIKYSGIYEAYYENGSLELSAEIKNGLLDGKFIHFSDSFQKAWDGKRIHFPDLFQKVREFSFLVGERHGLATIYYPDGRLKSTTYWHQGIREGGVFRYSDDLNQKLKIYFYKEGKLYEISK